MSAPALAEVDLPLHEVNVGAEYRAAVGGPPADGKRYGSTEPRVVTPPRRLLTPESSWGFRVIEFATDVLRVHLYPWQRSFVIRLLERNEDGSLRFQTAVLLVGRQNGKSTISKVLALWFMLEMEWPLVLGTAQDLETAEEIWEDAVNLLLEETDDEDDLSDFVERVIQTNGKKALILNNGSRYKVKAANRAAGRGLSGNLIMLDELREQKNWGAWGAITKTTQAQDFALVLGLSNAGDALSVVLAYLRKMAHAAVGDPDGLNKVTPASGPTILDIEASLEEDDELFEDDDPEDWEQDEETLFLAEYSATPGIDRRERSGWAQANPLLGYRIRERKLASDCRTDPEWVFRTEVLCQWPDGTIDGIFPPGSWEDTTNVPETLPDGTQRVAEADRIVGPIWVGLDKSADRSQTWITFAGHREDGLPQVEVRAVRHGDDWVKGWLLEHEWRDRFQAVTGQGRGAPISDLLKDFDEDPTFGIPVEPWSGGDLIAAHGQAFEDIRDGKVRHNKQPPLDAAAATAVRKDLGDGWVIDRKRSPSDVASLIAWLAALWLMKKRVAETPAAPPPAALEDAPNDDMHDSWTTSDLNTIGF
ncbi:MAG: hypothetical protein ACTH6N_08365 [Brachybacterium tyrofermentans]|uniref:hypothetical protein n=1 Tax=Brachybacterium tyrofermentans TaxID=47848 RepID=UPI0018684C2B|nr:hypothetical protein [Brachybacterium tyrofermentans]